MYAVVEVGTKQYAVKKDDVVEVERQIIAAGEEILLDKVLLAVKDDKIEVGQPYLKGAVVKAEVVDEIKAAKVLSFKYRRRKSSHWKKGHRQKLTRIKITDIKLG
ncbi:MAG: 50S ribosomal protein L21 [Candidatus Omnitrophica bacterium]|jgi:large subunit ribosomal protein L21|nr:50S ribosomal protein L21 [Candidatus Omnitrophota bacterium]